MTKLHVSASALIDIAGFESLWKRIESQSAQRSPFQSWAWCQAWLEQLPEPAQLLLFQEQQNVVGLALLYRSQKTLGSTAYLFKTGVAELDQVWIELNDVLAIEGYQEQCREALLEYFGDDNSSRLIWELAHPEVLPELFTDYLVDVENSLSYQALLKAEMREQGALLASFSKNTRAQLRRAMRELSAIGQIELQFAQNEHTAADYWHACGVLHRQRWGQTASGSGFDNPRFLEFHAQYQRASQLGEGWAIARLSVGGKPLAYLYYLLLDSVAYFYLSGINYDLVPTKCKPGMIAHLLAMQHFASHGFTCYDFLAGEAQYKRSLSHRTYTMRRLSIEKKNLRNRLVNWLRNVKSKL